MDAKEANRTNGEGLPALWTVEALAEHWRIRPDTLRAMARRGELPFVKLGRKVMFPEAELRERLRVAR